MLGNRYIPGQSSALRKSRLESKPSLLPKPRNAGSVDRLSADMRRPSNARSSSAEPQRGTMGGVRLSREASATKIPINKRSRSQQGEPGRYSHQVQMTPLRSSQFRPTTTPQRTPSEDRTNRSWQTSLDRAIASVTLKDQRPISNPAWQRSTCQRVQEALAERGCGGQGLMRPLTITRFVELVGALLDAVEMESKLNNDNYVTKLPLVVKKLLYPGAVSKSWLRTVNTLHAFPHALALLAYLLDLVQRIDQEVTDEWLYMESDDLAILRRDFLYKSWIRFQEPSPSFDDIMEHYLKELKSLLGDDEEKIAGLMEIIKKYELCLDDEAELAAKADEAARSERRAGLLGSLRASRTARVNCCAALEDLRAMRRRLTGNITDVQQAWERALAESQQVRKEVEEQQISRAERTKLLDEVDYANRVQDSKRALAEQISKMLYSKEAEVSLWQRKTLDSCVQYKQGVIHLGGQYPQLLQLQPDEKELMGPECAAQVSSLVELCRQHLASLTAQLAAAERDRNALRRRRHTTVEDTRAKIVELKQFAARKSETQLSAQQREREEAAAASESQLSQSARLQEIRSKQKEYSSHQDQLQLWHQQEQTWCSKLDSLLEYVSSSQATAQRLMQEAKRRRGAAVLAVAKQSHDTLGALLAGRKAN